MSILLWYLLLLSGSVVNLGGGWRVTLPHSRLFKIQSRSDIISHSSTPSTFVRVPWRALKLNGEGVLQFVQGICTNNYGKELRATTSDILNSKGKVIAHSLVKVCSDTSILLLTDFRSFAHVAELFNRMLFPADKVDVSVVEDVEVLLTSKCFSSKSSLGQHGDDLPVRTCSPCFPAIISSFDIENPFFSPTYSNTEDCSWIQREPVCSLVLTPSRGLQIMDSKSHTMYELLRVKCGYPAFPFEIQAEHSATESAVIPMGGSGVSDRFRPRFTSFELGTAERTIALNKGCYTGQEVVNGLLRTMKQRQELPIEGNPVSSWLEERISSLAGSPALRQYQMSTEQRTDERLYSIPPGTIVLNRQGDEVGVVTSCGCYCMHALGYKCKTESTNNHTVSGNELADRLIEASEGLLRASDRPFVLGVLRQVNIVVRTRAMEEELQSLQSAESSNQSVQLRVQNFPDVELRVDSSTAPLSYPNYNMTRIHSKSSKTNDAIRQLRSRPRIE